MTHLSALIGRSISVLAALADAGEVGTVHLPARLPHSRQVLQVGPAGP